MEPIDHLKAFLLDLGLEDWIPLPEAAGYDEVRDAVGADSVEARVSEALLELLNSGDIAIFEGQWDEESEEVTGKAARESLSDLSHYEFHPDDPRERRVYYVNVRNIR